MTDIIDPLQDAFVVNCPSVTGVRTTNGTGNVPGANIIISDRAVCVELTKGEAHAVAEFIDMNLIDTIRNDTDIDSMLWLRRIIHAFEKLCKYSGYDSRYADEEEEDKYHEFGVGEER